MNQGWAEQVLQIKADLNERVMKNICWAFVERRFVQTCERTV